ncbi:MAG: class I SAM-dependent methyltransferase, partial [Myxococcota bacterium]
MNRYFGLHTLEGEWHALLPRYLFMADRVRGRRVLDIGCGSGLGASLVFELGAAHVDAIDHRPEVLELARIKHDKEGIDFHIMLLEEFGFADDSFDVILCLDPSSPVTDPNLLREVKRVLAPSGQYICAIERKTIQGLEALLPRYGYSQPAEEVALNQPGQRVPQIGELSNRFAHVCAIVQRPLYSFVFDTPGDGAPTPTPPPHTKPPEHAPGEEPEEGERLLVHLEERDVSRWIHVDRTFSTNEADIGGVEIWFCADHPIDAPQLREVRLPYYSVVDRLRVMLHNFYAQQTPPGPHDAHLFAEVSDPKNTLQTGTWRAWGVAD